MKFTPDVKNENTLNKHTVSGTVAFSILCVLLLSGCSYVGGDNKAERMQAPAAAVKAFVPPPSPVDTLRAFAPPTGLKTTRLFDVPVTDKDARIQRLEMTVQSIKDDFDTVTPTIVRLAAVEKDMKGLIGQLEELVKEEEQRQQANPPTMSHMMQRGTVPTEPPMQAYMNGQASALPPVSLNNTQQLTKAEPIPQNTQMRAPVAQQNTHRPMVNNNSAHAPAHTKKMIKTSHAPKTTVKKIRLGEHVDKTRVVMDLSSRAQYQTRLADDGRSLVVKLSNAAWTANKSWVSEFSPLVTSYQVTQDGDAQRIMFQLRYPAELLTQDILPPQFGKGYRLVLDLQSSDVHLP